MSLSRPMKWILTLMREEGVTIQRRNKVYRFNPQPHATRGRPNRESVLALERRGLIALERVGAMTAYVLTEKGKAR